jgi:hypothetical protein
MIDLHSPAVWQYLLFGFSAAAVISAGVISLPRKLDLFQLKGQKQEPEPATPAPVPVVKASTQRAPMQSEMSGLRRLGVVKAAITKTARVTYTSSQKLLESIKPTSPNLGQG